MPGGVRVWVTGVSERGSMWYGKSLPSGGRRVSDRQWRDIAGIIAASDGQLDLDYLERWARVMGLVALYERAIGR